MYKNPKTSQDFKISSSAALNNGQIDELKLSRSWNVEHFIRHCGGCFLKIFLRYQNVLAFTRPSTMLLSSVWLNNSATANNEENDVIKN